MYTNKLGDKLTMVIQTCEKFSDLWDTHAYLLNKNWPDRDIRTLLVTDKETNRAFENIEVFSAGEGLHMPARMEKALPTIDTEYVLLTLDDYFPIYKVDTKKLSRLVEIMEKEEIDYIRLFNDPPSKKKFKSYDNLFEIDMEEDYAVNLYQGIWRKKFIEETIKKEIDIWLYEVSLTYTARDVGAKCIMSKGGEFKTLDVVRKGKLLHKAERYLRKNNLYHGNREIIRWKEELRIFIFSTGKKILPKKAAIKVKEYLKKKGLVFFSDKYKEVNK